MADKLIPKCPMGHEMALIQIAAGGWRYGCIRCATSFKARKTLSCGWLSPIKSTKERALEAAMKRPLQKPLTCDEGLAALNAGNPVWIEERHKEGGWKVPEGLNCVSITDDDRKLCGITWRPWATRPTDEERAAAKWEEAAHAE